MNNKNNNKDSKLIIPTTNVNKLEFTSEKKIILILVLLILSFKNNYFCGKQKQFFFDKYETGIYNNIKQQLYESNCSYMWGNQREFLNGIIRKYLPKKILELGVKYGGSSIVILNAIKDIKNAHLYSIDIENNYLVGNCVRNNFPYLSDKWTLFKGNIAANYIEKIGKNIDLVMIDTSHFEPGEILDFLMILPFVKEEAIIIFHDIDQQITKTKEKGMREEWAPYIIFNIIRGQKFLPSGDGILNKDIGAIKLEKNQKRFVHDYCRALGGQWQYFPKEGHIKIIQKYFEKYYDNECQIILNETVNFNRQFIKNNPKENFYEKFRRKNG